MSAPRNLPPLPYGGGPWVAVQIAPAANGVYDLQLTNGMCSPATYADGFWHVASFHGTPLRMPVRMLGTFAKYWRTQNVAAPLAPIA